MDCWFFFFFATKDCLLLHKYKTKTMSNENVLLKLSQVFSKRPFATCPAHHYESQETCIVFIIHISFHSNENKNNFHMNSFAKILAFVIRFKETRKLP